ncbi:MAG: type II toxin-antitoxin system RelE/ParE family toxin [Chloroflexi bacterium]|nr:type II toxin-antitoxin system RelE/ParE family toxin [Chloroflexota bacterium]
MAHRYEFLAAAARDLFKLTRHNQPLLHEIATVHIPVILRDPYRAGEPKKGDLAHTRAYDLMVKGVAYRLVSTIEGEVVLFIAIGPHDTAYQRARRR